MKPGTFTQLYVQLVFAVKNREARHYLLTKKDCVLAGLPGKKGTEDLHIAVHNWTMFTSIFLTRSSIIRK